MCTGQARPIDCRLMTEVIVGWERLRWCHPSVTLGTAYPQGAVVNLLLSQDVVSHGANSTNSYPSSLPAHIPSPSEEEFTIRVSSVPCSMQAALKILKEIFNKSWTSANFPHQGRAAMVIPIPKPNKDHTDPLSYRPITLTSCLCKVLEYMINTCFIWYLETSEIFDRSQCGFRKHHSTVNHLVSLERYLRDAFAWRQQAVGLFFDLEKSMRQPGNMVLSGIFTGLASEADCLLLY